MNLEILEEYIQQEWAPDFHYAHYEGIPWPVKGLVEIA
jgi:hypothetical protein